MDDSTLADPAHALANTIVSSGGEARMLWWRDPTGDVEVPRGHGVGWATLDGSHYGRLTLPSDHLRLDAHQVRALLTDRLGPGDYQPLDHDDPAVSPAVRLHAEGHVVVELDLSEPYGPGCLVGVAVELRGRGVAARVAVQPDLPSAQRFAALGWAESQVHGFLAASRQPPADLDGWTQMSPSRWQTFATTPIDPPEQTS